MNDGTAGGWLNIINWRRLLGKALRKSSEHARKPSHDDSLRFQVIGFGAMNIDQVVSIKDLPCESAEMVATDFQHAPGGSAANTIYGLARLGLRTSFLGTVGNDQNGTALLKSFRSQNIDASLITVKPRTTTGLAVILSTKSGERISIVSPGANRSLNWRDIKSKVPAICSTALLHLSSFAGDDGFFLQRRLVDTLVSHRRHPQITFAPGELYARKGLAELEPILRPCALVTLNLRELQLVTGITDVVEACDKLKRYCDGSIAVTFGAGIDGRVFERNRSDSQWIRWDKCPAHSKVAAVLVTTTGLLLVPSLASGSTSARPVDTTGAGDAFTAGLLWGFLNQFPPAVCGLIGQAVAHLSISQKGARKGLPDQRSLEHCYAALYSHNLDKSHEAVHTSSMAQIV